VALVGPPNVGKSTLLNALVGERLAAVSPKEQTTRHRIPGFLTDENTQIVFVDMPGLLDPSYPLQEAMVETALSAMEGVDLVYWLVDHDAPSEREREILKGLEEEGVVLFLVQTKSDQVPLEKQDTREETWSEVAEWQGRLRTSAVTGEGLDQLVAATRARLPEQPFFYGAEDLTTLNLRFIAAEMIREASYASLGAEVPYSVHVEITDWKDPTTPGDKTVIEATMFVERESQKGIVIGEGGGKLKEIGTRARKTIEELLDGPVYLSLWVKVRKKWSRRETDLKFFGYK
jgi:GTP-binding protein Era